VLYIKDIVYFKTERSVEFSCYIFLIQFMFGFTTLVHLVMPEGLN